MLQFNEFVYCSDLMDLPLHGRKFMWCNAQSASRIDQALVNLLANSNWPLMTLEALPRRPSDHNPTLFTAEKQFD